MSALRFPRHPDDDGPRFYSVAEVARIFGMSTMTVYRAIAAGEFPAVKIRGRLIIPAKALDALIEQAVSTRAVVDPSTRSADGG